MAEGPGKYDELCTHVRVESAAECAIVIVVNGIQGSGFSVQASEGTELQIAILLENLAARLRQKYAQSQH